MKRKFIIDTDCGLDDAMAIMMALASPNIEILAITCVRGNTNVDNVARNVFRTKEACGKMEIPVYKGASDPIMGKYSVHKACDYHGFDGFGDVFEQMSSSKFKISPLHAVSALTQIVNEQPGIVTIVTLGALTNIALAIRMDETFSQNVKEIFMMGGNSEGQGNITVSAEANFFYDPEAAYIVLNEMRCPITIATWELCLGHSVTWDWRQELLNLGTKQAELIKLIEHSVEDKSADYPGYILCDQIAMAVALTQSSILSKSGPYYVTVEPHGHYTRGQMVIDKTGKLHGDRNAIIIDKLNMTVVKDLIFKAMS